MIIGVLVDRLPQFKHFIIQNDLDAYNECIAHNKNADTYMVIRTDIDVRGFKFDKFIDLRELSIDVIASRMINVDSTINNYKLIYNDEE